MRIVYLLVEQSFAHGSGRPWDRRRGLGRLVGHGEYVCEVNCSAGVGLRRGKSCEGVGDDVVVDCCLANCFPREISLQQVPELGDW